MMTVPQLLQALAAYLLLPLGGLLLGWASWRLARGHETSRPAAGALVAVGLVVFAWVGVVLAAANLLHPWLLAGLCAGLLVIGLATWRRGRPTLTRASFARRRPTRGAMSAALLVLVAAGLLARPAETYLVTDDAAVYTLGAIHLSETGSLQYDDPGVLARDPRRADLPVVSHSTAYWDLLQDYARQFLLPENVGTPAGTRFWGPFFVPVLYLQQVEIGLLPLTKVFGAVFGWLFGARQVIWAGPALTLLSLAALLGVARREAGWGLAVPAVTMLALSLPQLWFGRQLLSEPLTQVLVFGVLWLDSEAHAATAKRLQQLLLGAEAAALGLLPLVRLEGALIAVLLLWWLVWNRGHGRSASKRLALLTGAALIVGQALALLVSPAYLFSRVIGLLTSEQRPLLVLALAAALILSAAIYHHRHAERLRCWSSWLRRDRVRQWLAAAVGAAYALVLLGQLIWPHPLKPYTRWLTQYWTTPALFLGALGMASGPLFLPREHRALRALLAAGACLGLLLAVDARVSWSHPWAMRRAMTLLLPALAVGATVTVGGAFSLVRQCFGAKTVVRWLSWLGFALTMSALSFGVARPALPLLLHREREGMWDQMAQVNELLAPHALLLLDDGQIGRQLGQALALVYGHEVYNIQQTETLSASSPIVQRLLDTARVQGKPTYWLVSDSARRFEPANSSLTSVGGVLFDTPTLSPSAGPPTAQNLIRQSFFVDIYAVLPEQAQPFPGVDLDLPLGAGSYPYLLAGFYGLEQDAAAGEYRWTAAEAEAQVGWPAAQPDDPASFELVVELSGWRPPGAAAPQVTIVVEGMPVIDAAPPASGELVELRASVSDLHNQGAPELEIELTSEVFVPQEYGMGADTRALGVKIYGLRLEPVAQGN